MVHIWKLVVDWSTKGNPKNGKCLHATELQIDASKGRTILIRLEDRTGEGSVVQLTHSYGSPAAFCAEYSEYPYVVAEDKPAVVRLKDELGLCPRPQGQKKFTNNESPWAQILEFDHEGYGECSPQNHSDWHVEC
jgi:hypothetical protein